MTARTLEGIEGEIAKLGSQKWYSAAHTLRLLAIAQEQRAEIARLKRAITELRDGVSWGEGVRLTYYMSDASAESVETIHAVTGE